MSFIATGLVTGELKFVLWLVEPAIYVFVQPISNDMHLKYSQDVALSLPMRVLCSNWIVKLPMSVTYRAGLPLCFQDLRILNRHLTVMCGSDNYKLNTLEVEDRISNTLKVKIELGGKS